MLRSTTPCTISKSCRQEIAVTLNKSVGESTVDALGPPSPAVLNCRAISRPFSFPKLENKDRLAIARRSLKDKSVTIVSVTRVLVSYVERHEKLDYLPNSNM